MAIYKIEYKAKTSILKDYINYLLKTMEFDGIVSQDKNEICLKLFDNDSNNYYFLEVLSEKLPISMYSGELEEIKKCNIKEDVEYIEAFRNLALSSDSIGAIFTQNSPSYYNPFITHSFFGRNYSYIDTNNIEEFSIFKHHHKYELYQREDDKVYKVDNNKNCFNELSQAIKSGKIVKIKTNFDTRVFGLNTKKNRDKFGDYTFFITDQFILDYKFEVSEFEMRVLNSIERPKVRLKLSESIDDKDYAFVKLPDDGFSYLLSNELKNIGIEYLIYTTNDIKADIELFFNEDINEQKDLEVYCIDKKLFLLDGDRGVFPKIVTSSDRGLFFYANDLSALRISKDRYLINKKEQFINVDIDIEKAKLLNRDFDDLSASILSVTSENNINDNSINLYLSTNSFNSSLSIKNNNTIEKKIIFLNMDNRLSYHLELLKDYDILVQKYLQDERLSSFVSNKKYTLDTLFDFISFILEIDTKDLNFVDSDKYEKFDISTLKINENYYMDYRDILFFVLYSKSNAKDYKYIIKSIFISLSNYFYYNINKVSNEYDIQNIVICGNIFYNKIFTQEFYILLEKHKIYKNIEFSMDRQNQIFGAINL